MTNKLINWVKIKEVGIRFRLLSSLPEPAGCLSGHQVKALINLRILSDTVIEQFQCFD